MTSFRRIDRQVDAWERHPRKTDYRLDRDAPNRLTGTHHHGLHFVSFPLFVVLCPKNRKNVGRREFYSIASSLAVRREGKSFVVVGRWVTMFHWGFSCTPRCIETLIPSIVHTKCRVKSLKRELLLSNSRMPFTQVSRRSPKSKSTRQRVFGGRCIYCRVGIIALCTARTVTQVCP